MGFGHRVYKSCDPRAKIIKKTADEVFEVTGKNPLLEIALELERIALQDEYFVKRKLYPNVDFYSGLIYQAMGFPVEMFPVLFAIPRTSGWMAQWEEMLLDPEQKIARPKQVHRLVARRDYVPRSKRSLRAAASNRRAGCVRRHRSRCRLGACASELRRRRPPRPRHNAATADDVRWRACVDRPAASGRLRAAPIAARRPSAKTRQYILDQLKAGGIRAQEQILHGSDPSGVGRL